jgi:hypothetical protein
MALFWDLLFGKAYGTALAAPDRSPGRYSYLWWVNGLDREGQRNWPDVLEDAFAALGHGG